MALSDYDTLRKGVPTLRSPFPKSVNEVEQTQHILNHVKKYFDVFIDKQQELEIEDCIKGMEIQSSALIGEILWVIYYYHRLKCSTSIAFPAYDQYIKRFWNKALPKTTKIKNCPSSDN